MNALVQPNELLAMLDGHRESAPNGHVLQYRPSISDLPHGYFEAWPPETSEHVEWAQASSGLTRNYPLVLSFKNPSLADIEGMEAMPGTEDFALL